MCLFKIHQHHIPYNRKTFLFKFQTTHPKKQKKEKYEQNNPILTLLGLFKHKQRALVMFNKSNKKSIYLMLQSPWMCEEDSSLTSEFQIR